MGTALDPSEKAVLRRAVRSVFFLSLFLPNHGLCNDLEDAKIALEQPQAQLTITGTLAKLDIEAGKGMLMTDLDKPIFFRLDRPDLFQRISIGDRVTMQLDEDGRVIKVIETIPAELHEPLPPAK